MELGVRLAGTYFKNPVFASAGDPTSNAKLTRKCIEAGVGAVIIKTMTASTNWIFVHGIVDEYVWTRMAPGFLDKYGEPGSSVLYAPGVAFKRPEEAFKIIKEIKPIAKKEEVVVIASIGSDIKKFEEWRELAKIAGDAGSDMVELMLGCPFMEKGRTHRDILSVVKENVNIPVIIKTPGENEFFVKQLAVDIEAGEADAWHVQGFCPQLTIDVETGHPVFPQALGYGRHGRGIGVYSAMMATKYTSIPILSSGGVFTWRDAIERMMAGATMVGIHSAVRYYGFKVFTEVVDGLRRFLERKGYEGVNDIVGVATPYVGDRQFEEWLKAHAVPKEKVSIFVDPEKCNGCGRCVEPCIFDAMTIELDRVKIDLELCERCGGCASLCPFGAITLKILE